MDFFMMGGFPMIVIVVFGALALVNAARFAWAPSPGRVPYQVALGAAILFAGLAGTAVDLMTVALRVPATPEWAQSPDVGLIVLTGFGESMAPTILAMGALIAQSLLVALGLRRGVR
ncbi:MAG: hypothetical protein Q8P18_27970 [Pseudomonadota bacterium]|nr:hypothetical protein [Pseudomonadota bacterium]